MIRQLFASPPLPPEQAAALRAAREEALHQIIRGVVVVAFVALLGFTLTAFVSGVWGSVALYAVMFVVLLVLAALRRMPLPWRGGIFVSLLFLVSIVSIFTTGVGGAGRVFLIGFSVLATAIFGTGAGIAAAVLSVVTWMGLGLGFSLLGWQPAAPNDSALLLDWISAGASTIFILVALIIPQRQFLETRLQVMATSREMAELAEAQARLQAQARALEQASREAREASQRLEDESRRHERRAALLALNAEVAHAASGVHELNELLNTTVNLIGDRFNYYHAGIFLLDDAREWAVLRAANSPGGRRMLSRGHRLRVGQVGIVGFVTATGHPRIALDVGADAVHFANPDLPDTHSELAVPIFARGQLIGALDVQSTETNAFSDEDVRVLQSLADQIGVAIDNARLFQETQRRLAELQALQQTTRRTASRGGREAPAAFRYDGVDVAPLVDSTALAPAEAPDVLQVPLRFGDQELGVLELKRAGEEWQAEDQELAATIADRMALALESAQLFESTRARAAQLATLSEVALSLTGPQFNPDQALEYIVHGAQRLFEVDGAGIWLPAGPDAMELRVTNSPSDQPPVGRRVKVGEGMAGQVFATGRPLRVDDYPGWVEKAVSMADAPFSAALAVPMLWQGEVQGVLTLTYSRPGRVFTPDEENIAQLYAAQGASTLVNARLFAETQQRLSELATINSLSQALTSQLDLQALLTLVGERLFETFGVPNGYIALYEKQTNQISFPFFRERGVQLEVAPRPLGQGLSSVIIQTRQPLLVTRNAAQRMAELGAITQGEPARSWLGVPITSADDVLGVISVQDLDREDAFTEADARLLSTIAASVGVAIQNARLFEQTQQRAEELAAINTISQALSTRLEPRAVVELVVERLRDVFDVDNAYLALYDRHTGLISIPYMLEGGQPLHVEPFPLGEGLTSTIIETRQPLLINRNTAERSAELGAKSTGTDARSYLGVPILLGADVLGVISVQDLQHEGRFSEADVRLLSTIAANVGVALQNAQLFEQTQERAAELAVVNELARAISQQLEPTQVLQTVYEQIQRITPLDGFFVTLYDESTGLQVTPVIYDGGRRYEEGPRPLPPRGLIRQVIETGETVLINRTPEEVERITLSPEHALSHSPQVSASLLYLPLHFGQRVGGVMSVQSYTPNAYSARHVEVLTAVANHVVVALQNARLFEETQRRAEQLATAADIGRATTSVLDQDALIVQAVELIRDRFERSTGVNYAAIFLIDETGRWARLRHATGEAGRVLLERQHRLEVGGNSMVGWATANRRARLALDVGVEPVRFANPLLPHTRSELALPLMAGDVVLGALDVQSTRANAFTEADVAVLQTMADQIAVALQNARLFDTTARQARRERLVVDITTKIRAAGDMDNMLRVAVDELRQALGARHAAVRLAAPSGGPAAPSNGEGRPRNGANGSGG